MMLGWPWSRKPDRDRHPETGPDRRRGAGTPGAGTPGAGTPGAGTPAAPRDDTLSARSPAAPSGPRDPASGSRPPPRESAAPGLAAFLEGVASDGRHSILDLGHAAGTKMSLYAPFARRMRFLDLLRPEGGATTWAEALQGIPRQAEHPYDLILGWDILDRLPPEHHAALVTRLARVSAPEARLHLLVDASPPGQPSPGSFRYTPVAVDRMEVEADRPEGAEVQAEVPGRAPLPASHRPRRLQPAQVERLLLPFRVTRGFTLRLGLREFVAVRREGGPVSDREGTGGS